MVCCLLLFARKNSKYMYPFSLSQAYLQSKYIIFLALWQQHAMKTRHVS